MATTIQRAVIIEPTAADSMAPLLERRPFGHLPLANRPLLHGLLAALAEVGIREVDLFLVGHPEETRRLVGNGEAWGLSVRCHSVGNAASLWRKPRRCVSDDEDVLVIGMELVADLAGLAARLPTAAGSVQFTDAQGGDLPVLILKAGDDSPPARQPWPGDAATIVSTPQELWQANLKRLRGLGGTNHVETRVHADLYLGPGCRLDESVRLADAALIGAESVLGRNVVVGEHSFIGRRCYVDEHAEIADSLVLEGSYVGPHAYIRGKIVDQSTLVDIETGITAWIDDPALLGASAEIIDGEMLLKRGYEWVLALVALLLTLPAWASWCLGRWLRGRAALEREVLYVPTRRALDGRSRFREVHLLALAGTRHDAWRRLPWLLAVLGRQLHLVGAARPLRKPAHALVTAEGVYGMLVWREQGEASLGEADYRPNAGLRFSLRVLAGWFVRLLQPSQRGA